MTTRDVIEELLYMCPHTYKTLWELKVLSKERNWSARHHEELTFMRYFQNPMFLEIIESQMHIYIIGDPLGKNLYNILEIEGFAVDHLIISKQQLLEEIKTTVSEPRFMADPYVKRVIFIKYLPDGRTDSYIFNRFDDKKFLSTKSSWSLGVDIYDADAKTYEFGINQLFKAILDEFPKISK